MSLVADRRRFNGPESSALLKTPEEPASIASTSRRIDGRGAENVRPIFIEPGLVSQASGSAFIEAGKTKLVCAVSARYGPHPARRDAPFSAKARLNVEARFAPFACRSRRRTPGKLIIQDAESPEMSTLLTQALAPAIRLDLMPKSTIDIFVTILECDGAENDPSLAITAASAALATAGIEMYGLVVGTSAGVTAESGLICDPTSTEIGACTKGLLHLAYLPALGTTTLISFDGELERKALKRAIERLKGISEQLHHVLVKRLTAGAEITNDMSH